MTMIATTTQQRLEAIYAEADRLRRENAWTREAMNRLIGEVRDLEPGPDDLEPLLALIPGDLVEQYLAGAFERGELHPGPF
jgi:predicted nuclease with TOPRIM domain